MEERPRERGNIALRSAKWKRDKGRGDILLISIAPNDHQQIAAKESSIAATEQQAGSPLLYCCMLSTAAAAETTTAIASRQASK